MAKNRGFTVSFGKIWRYTPAKLPNPMPTLPRAQPALEFIAPRLNPWVLRAAQTLLPFWLHWKTPLAEIEASGLDTLTRTYADFQAGNVRLLLAFRHPSVNDPYCLGYLCWKLLPESAQRLNSPLNPSTHAHFMYDRGIPLWAGKAVGWLYSRLGGTSIQRGKLDLAGLRSARDLLVNADYPLAAAPEGATNGHNEVISPLEPGIVQLGFWGVEDLRKAQRDEKVLILPIGIQYFYLTPPWQEIESLLTGLEQDCGIQLEHSRSLDQDYLYQRLYRLGETILSEMERFYRTFYHQSLPKPEVLQQQLRENLETVQDDENNLLSLRLQNLLQVALGVAEQYFNLAGKGTITDRCRRLEQAGWDYIYRDDIKEGESLPAVQQGLADRLAEEASLRLWHMRLVESFVAVTGHYVKEKPSVERFADTLLLLWDVVTRIKGEAAAFRPSLGKQKAVISIAEPLVVTDYWADYKQNRRQAIASLTQDLQDSLARLITHETEA